MGAHKHRAGNPKNLRAPVWRGFTAILATSFPMLLLLPASLPLTSWRGSSAERETHRAHRARASPCAARQGRHSWSNRIAICRIGFPPHPLPDFAASRARACVVPVAPVGPQGRSGRSLRLPLGGSRPSFPVDYRDDKNEGEPSPKIIEKGRKIFTIKSVGYMGGCGHSLCPHPRTQAVSGVCPKT